MKILVSNDDGVQAPGILALAAAMSELAEVRVVAPDRNCSAASNSLTLSMPIRAWQKNDTTYAVQGTPADCVNIALNGMLDWQPDMVVSGINAGPNMGDDVLYSGTVAAAIEGRHLGLPAIAFSLAAYNDAYYPDAARVAAHIVRQLGGSALPSDTILNVNIPPIRFEDIAGYRATRLGHRHQAQNIIRQQDPRGEDIYWIGGVGEAVIDHEGTDFHAIDNHYVSVTPIDIDMTGHDQVERIGTWLNGSQS